MKLPIEIASRRRRANFDAHEIGQPVSGPLETLDSDEPWMGDHFTQENFEQLQDAQMGGELGPALDLSKRASFARRAGRPESVMDLIRAKAMAFARDYFRDNPEHLEDAEGYAVDLASSALFGANVAGVSKSVAREVAADAIVEYAGSVMKGRPIRLASWDEADLEDACWDDYEAIGMKEKGGRMVPNCVPVKEARFHEGPEGRKEFEEWKEDQPADFQEEWDANTEEFGDQFKKASRAPDNKSGALETLLICENLRWPANGTMAARDPSSRGAWIIVNPSKRKAYSVHTGTQVCEEFDYEDVMDAYEEILV